MRQGILIVAFALAARMVCAVPPVPNEWSPSYTSECWRGAGAYAADGWTTDVYPDTGIFATFDLMPNEPGCSYPYHSGVVTGLSDTTEVLVLFHNRNQTPYSLSGISPETWFTPVLYPVGVDIWKVPPLTIPATFGWRFDHWQVMFQLQCAKPSALVGETDDSDLHTYALVYYCWGLPAGRYQLMMTKTAQAPTSFKLLKSSVVPAWVVTPTSKADTINAYAACFWRAMEKQDKSATGYWVNQILAKNPFSIPGYALKAQRAAFPPADTIGYYAATDSALAIINRYGDPLLPDSAGIRGWVGAWYEDIKYGLIRERYYSQQGLDPDYP